MLRKRSRLLRTLAGAVLAVGLVLGLAGAVYAADFRSGQEIVIGIGEVVDDDVYAAGERVIVSGTIRGDLYVAARDVVINGTVEGDLVCGAQFVTILGDIGHNSLVGAMSLYVGPEATLGHNLLFGGFALNADPGSVVGHDLLMGGYQAQLGGEVAQDVRAGLGAMELSGTVGRNVNVQLGDSGQGPGPVMYYPQVSVIDPGLRIASTARIGGYLAYESVTPAEVSSGAQIQGETRHTRLMRRVSQPPTGPEIAGWIVALWLARIIGTFIALLIVGALVYWLAPAALEWANGVLVARPWASLGWGCLAQIVVFIGVPVAILVVLIVAVLLGVVTLAQLLGSALGLGLSVIGLFSVLYSIVSVYVTKVVVAARVGRMILGQADRPVREKWFWPLFVGVVLFVLLRAIPILGGIVSFIVTLFGLGAIVLSLRDHWRSRGTVAPVGEV